ncbi:hypothetical protein CEE34_07690 [Candidatus Aerophobetes bacterium Ae_b3a]|nr:MAG: hypothetical protein CEE34_07690 [Candidatus Aerophobetes bacterium Ae_b3a]
MHNQKTAARAIKVGGQVKWISERNDILGCIDIISVKGNSKPLFIQCTLHTGVKKRLKELAQCEWPFEYVSIQLWQKRDREINIKESNGRELVDCGRIVRGELYRKVKTRGQKFGIRGGLAGD